MAIHYIYSHRSTTSNIKSTTISLRNTCRLAQPLNQNSQLKISNICIVLDYNKTWLKVVQFIHSPYFTNQSTSYIPCISFTWILKILKHQINSLHCKIKEQQVLWENSGRETRIMHFGQFQTMDIKSTLNWTWKNSWFWWF